MKRRYPISLTLMALGLVATSGNVLAGDQAAEVVFAIGDVKISQNGQLRPLQRGEKVYAGDELLTGSNGHIHLKTIDAGFVSVRPASRLLIHQYHYSPQNPKDNAIRFELKNGVVRSVTGKAGEMAKDKFRLSTPVAAIGIRGTDFTVYTSNNETRVAVRSGGVAVSPFNASCVAAALGPCRGSSVADLYAGNNSALLQVRSTDGKPMLRQDKTGTLLPESIAPALPEEQQSVEGKPVKTSQLDYQDVLQKTAQGVDDKLLQQQVPGKVQAQLEWGRWAGKLQDGSTDRLILALGTQNALYRTAGEMTLPERGRFDFKLKDANAVLTTDAATNVRALTVDQARLSIDFATKEFTTALQVQGGGLKKPAQLGATGGISADGKMDALQFWYGNTMSLSGGLSGDGKQAAYVFQQKLPDGGQISGATSWQR